MRKIQTLFMVCLVWLWLMLELSESQQLSTRHCELATVISFGLWRFEAFKLCRHVQSHQFSYHSYANELRLGVYQNHHT